MLNIQVCCRPVFHFIGGNVTGEIRVDPDSIVEAIFLNTCLDYRSDYRLSTRKLIAEESERRLLAGNNTLELIFKDGIADKNFMPMTLHDAMDWVLIYINFQEYEENPDSKPKRKQHYWEDVRKLRNYIYACDKCKATADTANVAIEE